MLYLRVNYTRCTVYYVMPNITNDSFRISGLNSLYTYDSPDL